MSERNRIWAKFFLDLWGGTRIARHLRFGSAREWTFCLRITHAR